MRVLLFIGIAVVAWCFTSFTHSANSKGAQAKALGIEKGLAGDIIAPPLRADLWAKYRAIDSAFSRDSQLGYFNGCVAISYHDTLLYQK